MTPAPIVVNGVTDTYRLPARVLDTRLSDSLKLVPRNMASASNCLDSWFADSSRDVLPVSRTSTPVVNDSSIRRARASISSSGRSRVFTKPAAKNGRTRLNESSSLAPSVVSIERSAVWV